MAKWVKGGRIDDPMVAISFILAGEPLFEGDKPQNAGWTQCWSISLIRAQVARGRLFIALPSNIAPLEAA